MPDEINLFESLDDLFSAAEAPEGGETRKKPFKFLDPYGPEDKDIFFGREFEVSEIFSLFYRSRVLLIFGESGSGKTSLIQCGLRSEIPPQDGQFLTIRSAMDPLEALRKEVLRQAGFPGDSVPSTYIDLLREAVFLKSKPLVLVFDQFEEFFIFQPESVRKGFIEELASWLEADINVRVIFGIRQEYLAHMSELETTLPQLRQNRFWVRRMSRHQAREVITGPCRKCGVDIENDLTDELLEVFTRGGKGVELPILQVVLDTLYNKAVEANPESPSLTLPSYLELGKIESILARFVEDKAAANENPERVRQVLKALVTTEGTRRISSRQEIAENAAQFGEPISEEELEPIIKSLIDDRIIREDADNHLLDLRHDSLAQVIRQWMTGIEQELMEVRQTLENRFKEYMVRGGERAEVRDTLLDASTLDYIAPYESRLKLKPELAEFVEKSKKEAARRRRRWRTLIGCTIGLFGIVVSTLSVFSYLKSLEAFQARLETFRAQGDVFMGEALKTSAARNFNATRLYCLHALSRLTGPQQVVATSLFLNTREYPILYTFHHDLGQGGLIYVVDHSPDGKTLATGSDDRTIRLWDLETGKERAVLSGHTGSVLSVSFSPDGKTLATGSDDRTIRLWDVETGKERAILSGHTGSVLSVSFSPDGKTVASGSWDKTVRLWDVETEREKATFTGHTDRVFCVTFSPDGKIVASGSTDTTVRLWDVGTGEERAKLSGHTASIRGMRFSPDGKTLATGSADNTIRLWDVETGKTTTILSGQWGHTGRISSVSFSPDGKTLASGAIDNSVRLWDVQTGEIRAVLTGHSDSVNSVSFSLDGRTLTSGSSDKTARLWDMRTGREWATLKRHGISVRMVRFSPDGKTLASASVDNTIRIWDAETGKERAVLSGHKGWLHCISFSPDGKTLASGSGDKTIRLWDLSSGNKPRVLTGHESDIYSLSFSPDGKTLASGSLDKTIRLWDVESGKVIKLEGHTLEVDNVSFSPDGKTLASGSGDKTIRLWDVSSGRELQRLEGHADRINGLSFSPDGKTLASASDDKTIRLWDVSSGKELNRLEGHTSFVKAVYFSPDGKTLASGSGDKTVRLWDANSGRELKRLEGHTDFVESISFSPDGKTLASASGDKTIRLWDLPALCDNRPLDERILEARHRYNLDLQGIEVKPIDSESNLHGTKSSPPEWPEYHPFHWLPAAERGDTKAMMQLGLIYARDDENEEALYWYRLAAGYGNTRGRERLELLEKWLEKNGRSK